MTVIRFAFVTLLTSDSYLPGALTIAAALKDVHRPLSSDQTVEYETACLVTPETVDVSTIRFLRKAFDIVIGVEVIAPPDSQPLTLLGRPDLDTALTKLHVFRLTQYSKIIFLDADVLPLRPLSHLFLLDNEFSAVPDVGWPDIFNSGVMVLSPGEDKFEELRELLNTKGSWDGADQGLLNEWRGDNWNRLSFTYNTTPTAIYTYAPAYHRFGSQISVVHFIGPHKPWHSIAYHALASSLQSSNMLVEPPPEPSTTHQHAYDYDSLVDRWYKVYDQHYRSQASETGFQPIKYTSAWNDNDLGHAVAAGGVLGLEELRRAALEGIGAVGIATTRTLGEGAYRTMPLEGRFDLVRPRTRAERGQARTSEDNTEAPASSPAPDGSSTTTPEPSTPPGQILPLPRGSPGRWGTLPTPGIHEIPPAPLTRLLSLPSTPHRHVFSPYKHPRSTREAGAQTVPTQLLHQTSEGEDLPPTPPTWYSAIETPPSIDTPAPRDTYFPKVFPRVWDTDQNSLSISPLSSETSLTTMEPSPSEHQPTPAFCSLTPVPATPEMPRRQGPYYSVVGEENASPSPDPTKVMRVFPWEERTRHTPGRVFPDEASLLSGLPYSPFPATPEKKHTFRSPMPSPLVDFPPLLHSHYPLDGLPPQRHAGKVPRSVPSPSPLAFRSEPNRAETSSQDGDVEDEVDSEEETVLKPRTRSSSIGKLTHNLKYRSVGVQTDPRDLREEGIQVTTFVPAREVAEKLILMNTRPRRKWSTSTGTARPPAAATSHISTSSPLSTLDSHHPLSPSDRVTSASGEIGDLNSFSVPAISFATSFPLDGDPPLSQTRKGSRVWDPARGVESFKRGSAEALTKFLKMGSREERA